MHLNENELLEEKIPSTGVTIVDFYAEWCAPCKMMSPVLDMVKKTSGVNVLKVDSELHPSLASRFSINSLPTLQFYKDGKLVETHVGAMPKPKIESIIRGL